MFPLKIFVDIFRSQMIENGHLDYVKVPLRVRCDRGSCAVEMKENNIQMGVSWELRGVCIDLLVALVRENSEINGLKKASLRTEIFASVFPSTYPSACRSCNCAFEVCKPYGLFWRRRRCTALLSVFLPPCLSYAAVSACIALSPLNGTWPQVKKYYHKHSFIYKL